MIANRANLVIEGVTKAIEKGVILMQKELRYNWSHFSELLNTRIIKFLVHITHFRASHPGSSIAD